MFGTSMNIFRWESADFLRRLRFSFLAGGGCAMFQILTGFSEFQLKSSFICLMEGLYMSYINHSKYLGDRFKPRMACQSVGMWLCCFKSWVSNFQNEANKFLKIGTVYYISIGLFCAIFHKSPSRFEIAIQLPHSAL